jgi:hypothetical protein
MPIKVLDHIIIGKNRRFSFADGRLIEEYELNYAGLTRRSAASPRPAYLSVNEESHCSNKQDQRYNV